MPGTKRSRYPRPPRRTSAFPSGERPGRRVRDAAPYNPPKAPSDEGAVSRQADWGRDTGGHMGPPVRKNRPVIRHCEEGRRPDVAIRAPVQERRIPTAPPGPRNDGLGTQCAPAGGHAGPPLQNPLKCNVERRRGQAPALQGCAARHPPHHGGATREGASKRVAETALWSCRTVATGGRTAMRQRPPRAGTFAPGFRTKLPS